MTQTTDTEAALETAHSDSSLEWWFVHGMLHLQNKQEVSFFWSFFRYLLDGRQTKDHGCMMLQLELDHASSRCATRSLVDESLFTWQLNNQEYGNLDNSICRKIAEEHRTFGPFPPISIGKTVPTAAENSARIEWEGCSLSFSNSRFDLGFTSTLTGDQVRLDLEPKTAVKNVHSENSSISGMHYRICPQLAVSGSWGDRSVSGAAWFDHQWGSTGWLISKDKPRRLQGWDWWGITFEDSSTMVVVSHWDAQTKAVSDSYAVLWTPDGRTSRAARVETTPLEYWTSSSTRITYPLAWRVHIPEFEADIEFHPTARNQEVHVFGLMRAIWEGHGTVSGTVFGKPARGWARAEFQGYGYRFSLDETLRDFSRTVEQHLDHVLPRTLRGIDCPALIGPARWKHEPAAYTSVICDPIWDLLDRKGKCWRPAIGILFLETLGTPSRDYEELISVMAEFTHAGSLIIDDIEDSALLRRGEEAVHLRYGTNTAINAGNSLYFLPLLKVFEHPLLNDTQKLHMLHAVNSLQLMAHFGQGADIYWSNNLTSANLQQWLTDSIEQKVLQMYAQKTAAGVIGLAECAAIVADCGIRKKNACCSFARDFGVAFQLIDDVHDYSSSSKWRKTAGEDFREGKLTYVLLQALQRLNRSDQARLIELFCSQELRTSDSGHTEGMELVKSSGAFESTKKEAHALFDSSWKHFSSETPPGESRFLLKVLSEKLLSLDYEN